MQLLQKLKQQPTMKEVRKLCKKKTPPPDQIEKSVWSIVLSTFYWKMPEELLQRLPLRLPQVHLTDPKQQYLNQSCSLKDRTWSVTCCESSSVMSHACAIRQMLISTEPQLLAGPIVAEVLGQMRFATALQTARCSPMGLFRCSVLTGVAGHSLMNGIPVQMSKGAEQSTTTPATRKH